MGIRPSGVSPKDDAGALDPGRATAPGEGPSKGRRIAFRGLAVVTSLWLLAFFVFGLTEVVLMWLPGETISSIVGDDFSELVGHRTHLMSVGIVAWGAVLAMLVQLRRPERRVAPMLQLVAIAVGSALVYAISATVGEWLIGGATILVPVVLLAWLHPRGGDLFRRPAFYRPLAGLAAVAAIPWAVYIVDNGRLQLLNAVGDSHAEMEHWATAALMAITIVVCAFLGSTDHAGWRLPAWYAVVASVIFGVHSFVFPGLASGLSVFWAVVAVVWGVAFGVGVVRRSGAARAGAPS